MPVTIAMAARKRIALIAHDNCKDDLLDWTRYNRGTLTSRDLYATGTTLEFVIFFWDPLEPHPHDVDVKALRRIAVVYNVPIACTCATADFLLSSPLMERDYERRLRERADVPRKMEVS